MPASRRRPSACLGDFPLGAAELAPRRWEYPGTPPRSVRPPPLGTGAALRGISGPPRRGCGTGAALRSLRAPAALGRRNEPRLPRVSGSQLGRGPAAPFPAVSGRRWAEALLEKRGVSVPRVGGGRGGKGRRVGQGGQRRAGRCPVLLASPGTEPLPPETTGALGCAGPSRGGENTR